MSIYATRPFPVPTEFQADPPIRARGIALGLQTFGDDVEWRVGARNVLRIASTAEITDPKKSKASRDAVICPGVVVDSEKAAVVVGTSSYLCSGCRIVPPPNLAPDDGPKFLDVTIGKGVLIGSDAIVSAIHLDDFCEIGENCVIGDRASIGQHVLIAPNSVIPPDVVCPPLSVWAGNPATIVAMLPQGVRAVHKRRISLISSIRVPTKSGIPLKTAKPATSPRTAVLNKPESGSISQRGQTPPS